MAHTAPNPFRILGITLNADGASTAQQQSPHGQMVLFWQA
jgi:hypothetical protein